MAQPAIEDLSMYDVKKDVNIEDSSDGEGDDRRLVLNEPPKAKKISEKRREDQANFDSWLEDNRHVINERPKGRNGKQNSTAALIKDVKAERIIGSPREYQIELFEVAKKQNTIAVLDTGSGKTLIAALLLRWTVENELEDRVQGKGKRIAFFLVDKIALVYQQHNVLENNIDCPMDRFSGNDIVAAGSIEFWKDQLERNMIVVCTAEILYQCLHHSYLRMEQINLLIFDEAHHTKKNHPYARIIKDFYLRRDCSDERRPRILGMTASPVDAQVDVRKAAYELETLLHGRIATPSDQSLLHYNDSRKKEEKVVHYETLKRPFQTSLQLSLTRLLGSHEAFRKAFGFALDAASQLGPWCADQFWQLFFIEEDAGKLDAKTERNFLKQSFPLSSIGSRLSEVREAREVIESHQFPSLQRSPQLLSSKVLVLLELLTEHLVSTTGDSRRCIIFVDRRYTAYVMADLLQQPSLGLEGLNVGVLVGVGGKDSGYETISFRHHIRTIHDFKEGKLDCLIATNVAEEGLDIPGCNLVIRFDLYKTTIQYIQSKGRARHEQSLFIHMIERGNTSHQRAVVQNLANEEALKKFCQALDKDRLLEGSDANMDLLLRKERRQRIHTVKSTGAVLNYKQSLVVLAQFVASLPQPENYSLTADFFPSPVPGGFQTEVHLPAASPIRTATGQVQTSKQAAKCSAAFEICLQLLQRQYLDDYLQPTFTKKLPCMRNARLAVSSKKKAEYSMRTKPELWSSLGTPDQLFAHILLLDEPEALKGPSSPLLLLTRKPIPPLREFRLFFGPQQASDCRVLPIRIPQLITAHVADWLGRFTLKIFQDIFSKGYEANPSDLPYFLAPCSKPHKYDFGSVLEPDKIIDWATLQLVAETSVITVPDDAADAFFMDKFVTDPWSGARKFILRKRRHDLKPLDPVPAGVPHPTGTGWKSSRKDIMNYSVSLWSKARATDKFVWREVQPVVEAEMVSLRRNVLDDQFNPGDDKKSDTCFLILEPLRISPLPIDVVAMAYNFPAIIYRIESHLIALDACRLLDLNVLPELALEAVTKDSDNTGDHGEEQISFQEGMGNNYERLEFLGDCFLKLATTVSIFTLTKDKDEFECHVERMLLVCNQNLFNHALDAKLEQFIRTRKFDRGTWYPEGLNQIKGKKHKVHDKHTLGDKSIADVCEALIGAAYLTARQQGNFDLAVKAVTTMVKHKNHNMNRWDDYVSLYTVPDWQTADARQLQLAMVETITRKTGYVFTYPRLLRCAFMHPSYPRNYEHLPSYQRLEFLGDALLDMACVDYLFKQFPGTDPQWLTEHKMPMVSNQFLGCLCVELGFHKHMVAMDTSLVGQMQEYVQSINALRQTAIQDAEEAGRKAECYDRSYWMDGPDPPKCLADIVEAYIGAMFVDSGYNYSLVEEFFNRHVLPYFADMTPYDTYANKHPITALLHMLDNNMGCSQHRILDKEVPVDPSESLSGAAAMSETRVVTALMIHGKVAVCAAAASSRYARQAMAKKAGKILERMARGRYREEYGCDCHPKEREP